MAIVAWTMAGASVAAAAIALGTEGRVVEEESGAKVLGIACDQEGHVVAVSLWVGEAGGYTLVLPPGSCGEAGK